MLFGAAILTFGFYTKRREERFLRIELSEDTCAHKTAMLVPFIGPTAKSRQYQAPVSLDTESRTRVASGPVVGVPNQRIRTRRPKWPRASTSATLVP